MFPARFRLLLLALGFLGLIVLAPGGRSQPPPESGKDRGTKPLDGPEPLRYRKQWALIIGINYKDVDAKEAGPAFTRGLELDNPENDAKAVNDLLLAHYGYQKENVCLLLGKEATRQNILDRLSAGLLGNTAVKPDDSILIFFAGHGDRLPTARPRDRGVIYPFDVKFHDHKPDPASVVRLHQDVLSLLQQTCPARHKLLVLDSCHSGEIFTAEARPRAEADNSRDLALFREPALQAIASCLSVQVSADGPTGSHSPFTEALLHGLETLPQREDKKEFFTANDLFGYVRPYLLDHARQSPDCRSLTDDVGEFRFFPQGPFAAQHPASVNVALLRALVPGEYGNWWFEEMPWMMPSLRLEILTRTETAQDRKGGDPRNPYSDAINKGELVAAVQRLLQEKKQHPDKDSLARMRLEHLQQLMRLGDGAQAKSIFKQIAIDLAGRMQSGDATPTSSLEATDLHFLAVVQQSLGGEDARPAEETYKLALDRYQKERQELERTKKSDQRIAAAQAMEALCLADLGNYQLEWLRHSQQAKFSFQSARACFPDPPPPFKVFLLCREADAWQRLGFWGEALEKLEIARHVATDMDPASPLTAATHAQRAWALLEQWRISEAEQDFLKANAILESNTDYAAQINKFQNRHGLALAQRLEGKPQEAAGTYRELALDISSVFEGLRNSAGLQENLSEIKSRLIERAVNTQERLADCNLFGDWRTRDLTEAADDYRRAIRSCEGLPAYRRDLVKAGLMYRRAIALALSAKSNRRVLALATDYLTEADALYKTVTGERVKQIDAYAALARPIVNLCGIVPEETERGSEPPPKGEASPLATERKCLALSQLREAVKAVRASTNQNTQRDTLEMLMFASRILVERAVDSDPYRTLEDTELLLSLCRKALLAKTDEPLAYLRPYYDTVVATKLRQKPEQVKELLEVVWEATRGVAYRKRGEPVPVLAAYVMGDRTCLFLDVPQHLGGASTFGAIEGENQVELLRAAMRDDKVQVKLPRDLERELDKVRQTRKDQIRLGKDGPPAERPDGPPHNAEVVDVEVWWQDPVLGLRQEYVVSKNATPGADAKVLCPFRLPHGLAVAPNPLDQAGKNRSIIAGSRP